MSPRALILNDGHYSHSSGFEEVSTCSSGARLLSGEDFLRGLKRYMKIGQWYLDTKSSVIQSKIISLCYSSLLRYIAMLPNDPSAWAGATQHIVSDVITFVA